MLAGCGEAETPPPVTEAPGPVLQSAPAAPAPIEMLVTYTEEREACANRDALRIPLFGDLHVHTAFSFDAAANSTGTYPDDAHRYARGEPIAFFPINAEGQATGTVQIDRPLDFLAVTDHAEFLGERELCRNPKSPQYQGEFCRAYRVSEFQGSLMLATVINQEQPERIAMLCGEDGQLCREHAAGPWQRIIDAAEAAYDRSAECRFTSFVGYENTGTPGNSNYHRNVIFRNGEVPELPISYVEAPRDYQLWEQLDAVCDEDCDYLTIPHNTNLSNGKLLTPYLRLGVDADVRENYARTRLAREPIMEIFQHKGNSECVNGLASVLGEPDELCNFERVRVFGEVKSPFRPRLEGATLKRDVYESVSDDCGDATGTDGMFGGGCIAKNDFLRSALLSGLQEQQAIGMNPVKLGIIASTDTHMSTPGAVVESDWGGHVSGESSPEDRLQPGILPSGVLGNPGGLAGVWAVENSRDAIFEALKRREVFGTSGPRIIPRFFAGWNFDQNLCSTNNMLEHAYNEGVPMGGDLSAAPSDRAPVFLATALRDTANGAAPLQKLQLVKGWIAADGSARYRVLDIAGSPDNGAGVDLTTGQRTGTGHNVLCTVFQDPDFEPALPAYYYLRVVENPSLRWSYYDCLRMPTANRPAVCNDSSVPKVIQELAWTSPIWYQP